MELRDYIRVLGRRRTSLVFAVVLFVSAALFADWMRPAQYTTEARILVATSDPAATILGVSDPIASQPDREMSTNAQMIDSHVAAQWVRRRLKLKMSTQKLLESVSAEPIESTNIIAVKATADTPQRAALLANSFASHFVEQQAEAQARSIQSARKELERQRNTASDKLDDEEPGSSGLTANQQVLVDAITRLNEQLERLQTGSAMAIRGTRIAQKAMPPRQPDGLSGPIPVALLGIALGLASGVALAFTSEHFDTRVKSIEDLSGLPGRVLGGLPAEKSVKNAASLTMLKEPYSGAADAYRLMRQSLQKRHAHRPAVLVVTPTEGVRSAAVVAANLGIALVQTGERVAVIDCDARRSTLKSLFELQGEHGLMDVLSGARQAGDVVQHPVSARLAVIPSGLMQPASAELLSSFRLESVVREIAGASDWVILVASAINESADSAGVLAWADAVLVVLTASETRAEKAVASLEMINMIAGGLRPDIVLWGLRSELDDLAHYLPVGEESARLPVDGFHPQEATAR